MTSIPFNKPLICQSSIDYMHDCMLNTLQISGNGNYTKLCHDFFQVRYGFKKVLLTSSCTDALEMSAILCGICPGDEVIVPSYTFVSTANAFALRGANLIFADCEDNSPSISFESIKSLCTKKTKAVVIVHYAGIACQIDKISEYLKSKNILLIEDCAHAIDAYFQGLPLGSFGDFSTFSFHETKNISSGEGGLLVINNPSFHERSEIIWEKGTNRTSFKRKEIAKYEWLDIGSSFLPSDLVAACLLGQLENIKDIQERRVKIWNRYYLQLKEFNYLLPVVRNGAEVNGHLFYLVCNNLAEREDLISFLEKDGIHAVFHYLPLHLSPYAQTHFKTNKLVNAENFADCLVRLPLFYDLNDQMQDHIIDSTLSFFSQQKINFSKTINN